MQKMARNLPFSVWIRGKVDKLPLTGKFFEFLEICKFLDEYGLKLIENGDFGVSAPHVTPWQMKVFYFAEIEQMEQK